MGIFGHQVRITPDGKTVILVCRGYDATENNPEQPGCLKLFHIQDDRLQTMKTINPSGGIGFGARHLTFIQMELAFILLLNARVSFIHLKYWKGKLPTIHCSKHLLYQSR